MRVWPKRPVTNDGEHENCSKPRTNGNPHYLDTQGHKNPYHGLDASHIHRIQPCAVHNQHMGVKMAWILPPQISVCSCPEKDQQPHNGGQ